MYMYITVTLTLYTLHFTLYTLHFALCTLHNTIEHARTGCWSSERKFQVSTVQQEVLGRKKQQSTVNKSKSKARGGSAGASNK